MEQQRARSAVSLEAAIVARRYYIDDRGKSEIADELGISRFKVARLLDEARASGIVRIYVDMPLGIDLPLGERLARAFGIARAIVVDEVDGAPGATVPLLGRAAAEYLTTALNPGDVLGVSWGTTLTAVADSIDVLPGAEVVQLVGGTRAQIDAGGVELVRRFAESTGGAAYPLHAPLLVGSAAMASELRQDPSLAEVVARFDRLSVALVGIGSWVPPRSSLYNEFAETDREDLIGRGGIGDICTIVVAADGKPVSSPALNRSIAVSLEQLMRTPDVVAVAGGAEKVDAIAAVLRAGVVRTLVTDATTAAALLHLAD